MYIYKNLILIGTSHISPKSLKEVENIILDKKPDIVAVELDSGRAISLMRGERRLRIRDIFDIGVKIFILTWVASWLQRKLGEKTGISPGSEMKKAIDCAYQVNAKTAFIDQDIRITLRKFFKEVPLKEKLKIVFDSFVDFFIPSKRIKINISEVPPKQLIARLLKEIKGKYPNFYKVLVYDRNKIMAKRLYNLMSNYNLVVGVVGAGHEEEIVQLIKEYEKA